MSSKRTMTMESEVSLGWAINAEIVATVVRTTLAVVILVYKVEALCKLFGASLDMPCKIARARVQDC